VGSLAIVDAQARQNLHELAGQAVRPGARVRRPGAARALRAIAERGRDGFYGGEFGAGLFALGAGHVEVTDLERVHADWVGPLRLGAWGHVLWTIPPNSQGYLTLAEAWIAAGLALPADPDEPAWAHLLVEAAIAAAYDRPAVLHDAADGAELLSPDRLAPRRREISGDSAANRRPKFPAQAGDTTYLCVVDDDRMAVSLIQSNASGFGSWLVEPNTGINLHNRGLGFSLEAGHPAEFAPGRRPPHTLSPLLLTRADGTLLGPLGTMGGDAQPQILLQLVARLLLHHQSPAEAIAAGRWVLHASTTGFDTWTADDLTVVVEGHAARGWDDGLRARGHSVTRTAAFESAFGHAHVILVQPDGLLTAAADPRARIGSAAGS
jgi:gamma-glutamyltranspeptidase/glutathione hydrolase